MAFRLSTLLFAMFSLFAVSSAWAEDAVDLSAMGGDAFTPYVFERNSWWVFLPLLTLAMVLLHLIKIRPPKKNKKRS